MYYFNTIVWHSNTGQPDNAGNDENCAVMWPSGSWNDLQCHRFNNYICERPEGFVQLTV